MRRRHAARLDARLYGAKGDDRIASATFLAAQVDFSEAGDLLVFIDDAQLKSLEEMMAEQGYLDGSRMAAVFNMLRPRDLIWPYVVNNYLLGKKPFPFDLLYWNADFDEAAGRQPRLLSARVLSSEPLEQGRDAARRRAARSRPRHHPDLRALPPRKTTSLPASSVFLGSKLFGGPVRFVMAGSGHIAGVVNPPARKKYQFWTGAPAASLNEWMAKAAETPGSWWPDWAAWLAALSGPKVAPRDPSAGPLDADRGCAGVLCAERSSGEDELDGLTLFGLLSVSAMLLFYVLEHRSPWCLAFAGACAAGSVYGFLQGAWPFGLVEAVWAVVALGGGNASHARR